MYRPTFGTKNQIQFSSESDYYQFIGYLAKGDGTTILVWEDNDLSGAWAKEGRILFFHNPPTGLRANLSHTAGVNNIVSRVNCNEFLLNLRNDHAFSMSEIQDIPSIRATVPPQFLSDFDLGLQL
jgi:hypothetical protein